jgi:hypothetical protein
MVALLLSTISSSLLAKTFTVDNIKYATTDSTSVKVTGTTSLYSITIPETVTDEDTTYTVTEIEATAFRRNTTLYKVVLPQTIQTIGSSAFYSSVISEINLPNGLTTIGSGAFQDCPNLKSISIPGTVITWDLQSFVNTGLVDVDIQEGVQTIPKSAFQNCKSLKNITISEGLKSIDESAFYGCTELHTIDLPQSLLTLGKDAFAYSGLYSIKIPDKITAIPTECFWNCKSLQHVTLPKLLKTLNTRAFSQCYKLEELSLPQGTSEIGEYAIEYCNNLKKVFIPESLQYIDIGNFHYIDSVSSHLQEIHMAANENLPRLIFKDGSKITDNEFNPFYNANIENVTLYVPKGTTSLYQNANVWRDFGNIVEESIGLNIDRTQTIVAGNESQINYSITPDIFPGNYITWTSSNENVATVNSSGVVTALSAGKTNIYATMETTYLETITDICQVTVVDNVDNYFKPTNEFFGAAADKNIYVDIDMNNQDDIIAFQCDIDLPEGLEFVSTDEGYDFYLSSRATRTHSIDGNIQYGGALRLVSYSSRNQAYTGNSGKLFTFVVKGASDGDYNVRISNIILTTSSLTDVDIPDITTLVKVGSKYGTSGGDVNMDGRVTVGDATATISYILEDEPSPFDTTVADINKDGIINISDVAGIISIILNSQTNEQANNQANTASCVKFRAQSMETDYLYANPITADPSSEYEIGVSLHNEAYDYCAFQCDIMFPEGMTAVTEGGDAIVDLSSRKKRSHTIAAKYVSSGALRVVSYSSQNAAYSGNDGELFSVKVETDSNFDTDPSLISISNVVFVNSSINEESGESEVQDFNFADAEISVNEHHSGLSSIHNEDLTITLNGRKLTIISPYASQLQITSIDGLTNTIFIKEGLSTYEIPNAGFYIINGENLIVK